MEPAPTITRPSPAVQPDGTDKVPALIAAIAQAQRQYSLDYVWTLTIRTATCVAEDSDKATKTFWARLRRDLWRRYGLFDFVLIREVTQRGLAHLHVYSSLRVPEDELRALWSAATGGSWVVKVQRVHPGRLVEYLTKQVHVHASVPSLPGRDWTTSQRIRLLDLIPARAPARTRSTLDVPSGVKHTRSNQPPPSGAPGAPLTGPKSPRGGVADPQPASDSVRGTASPGSGDTMIHTPPSGREAGPASTATAMASAITPPPSPAPPPGPTPSPAGESARAAAPSRAAAESPSGGVPTLSIIQPLTAEQGAMDRGAREREHIAAAAIVAATLPGVGDPPTTHAAAIGGLRAALERAQEAGTLPASLRPLLLAKRAAALATPLPCGAPPSGTPEPPGPARQTRHRASQRCPRPVSGAPAPVPRAPDPLPGLSAAPRAVSDAPATRPLTGGPPVPPSAPVLTAEQPVSGAPAVSAQRVSFAAYPTARGLKMRPGPGRVMALATAQREADKRAPQPQPDLGVIVRAPCPVCEPPQQGGHNRRRDPHRTGRRARSGDAEPRGGPDAQRGG